MPSTISMRLPDKTRAKLDAAASRMGRSRSYVIQRALELQLGAVEAEAKVRPPVTTYSFLRSLAGSGATDTSFATAEDVDSHIRSLRDGD